MKEESQEGVFYYSIRANNIQIELRLFEDVANTLTGQVPMHVHHRMFGHLNENLNRYTVCTDT